jgi:Rrf2 family protein
MKLSTRFRYGTRLILELALNYDQGPVFLKDISNSQEISLKYLGQIVIKLKSAGIVSSTRGAHGGYYLTKHPENIRLSEIIEALDGPFILVECINDPQKCSRYEGCVARIFWMDINDKFYNTLDSITVQDLLIQKIKRPDSSLK